MKRRDTYDKDSGCISTLVCVWVVHTGAEHRTLPIAGHRRVVRDIGGWVVQNIGGWVVPDIRGWVVKDIGEWLVKDIEGWLVKDIDSGW